MIADLKPYSAIKDSSIEWLGDVPEHWKVVPLKRIGRFNSGAGFPIALQGRTDEEILFVKVSDMNILGNENKIIRSANTVSRDVAHNLGAYVFQKNTIIFPKVGGALLTNKRRILFQETCIDNNLMGCIVTGADVHFTFRILLWLDLGRLAKPGPVPAISEGEVREIRIPIPPLPEQTAIVRYLDYVDRRVRRFVRAKEKLIGLLEEQKQVIIHRVVTRGLDPDVPLKSSGVEWLGDVPEHWEVIPLKRIVWFNSGAGFPISLQGRTDEEILFVKVSDMNILGNEYKITRSVNTVSRDVAHNLGAYVFQKNAIIFPKVGGALLTNKRRMLLQDTCIDNNLMGCVVTGADVNFAFRILLWLDLGRLAKPGPVPAISEGEVREIRIPLPPRSEQTAIVKYLDKATADIDTAITRARREVELLNEYRTRLIADVVTGKLDVREAAAQLPDETGEPELPDENDAPTGSEADGGEDD